MPIPIYEVAKIAHGMNATVAAINGAAVAKKWDQENEKVRRGWIYGVVYLVRTHCTYEELHKHVFQMLVADGYKHGDHVDHDKKMHIACLPFADMPNDYKMRMELFHALINNLKPYIS